MQTVPIRGHLPVLDGVRGIAIALVMLHHFLHNAEAVCLVDQAVFSVASRAWAGVDLFLVLSGFLITGILWDCKGRDGYLKNFYMRRVLRIFPAYYAVLLLIYVVFPLLSVPGAKDYVSDSSQDQVWFWTYLANFRLAWRESWYDEHIPNVLWSLAIEEQFYLVWPFVVLLCKRRTLMVLCGVLAAASLATRVGMAVAEVDWVASFVLTPSRWDGLVFGAWLALWIRGLPAEPERRRHEIARGRNLAKAAVVVSAIVLAWLMTRRGADWRMEPRMALRFTVIAAACAAVLYLGVTSAKDRFWNRWLSVGVLRMLGKYSYALYLWHGPADWVARRYIHDPLESEPLFGSMLPAQICHAAIAGTLSLLVALVSWNLLEKHFLRLKSRFPSGHEPPSTPKADPSVVKTEV